ncbi:MAG: hypothetical protein AcusKO_29450 [Acuticoccus sp.]
MSTLLTNADFARAVGVTPARVSQWKSEGKITAAALISQDGRTLIDAERACEDLGRRLDLSQMTGNGATTRLGGFFDGAKDDQSGPLVVAPGGEQAVADRFQQEKLREIEFRNRAAAKREAEEAGVYVRTTQHQQTVGRVTGLILREFETAMPEIASALAGRFELQIKDVSRELAAQLRIVRGKVERELRRAADGEEELVTDEILSGEEPVQGEA